MPRSRALTGAFSAGQHGYMIDKPKKPLTPKQIAEIMRLVNYDTSQIYLSQILDVSPDKAREWEKHGTPPDVTPKLWMALGAKRGDLAAALYGIMLEEPLKPWERGAKLLSEYEGLTEDPTMIFGDGDEEGCRHMVVRVIADMLHYCMDQMTRKRIFIDLDAVIKEAIAMYNSDPEHSATPVKTPEYLTKDLIPFVFCKDPAIIAGFEKKFGITQDQAVDEFIEESDWGEDLPNYVGHKGLASSRLEALRRALRAGGITE